ncbi:hypothetical protein RZE82_08675 [Mollicutes bacterium LVI A0039]|nr:hypothetical protein RZE82_08675 [Mollicutes bacterium LVI A0039]
MKKILFSTYLFLMIFSVILFAYAAVSIDTADKLLVNTDSVSIILDNYADKQEFEDFLIKFSSDNDVKILKATYYDNNTNIYSTKEFEINNSITKNGNTAHVYGFDEIKNAGYDGIYKVSSKPMEICQGVTENGFGTCEVNSQGDNSNMLIWVSMALIIPLLLSIYIIFSFIVLTDNKKFILQYTEGMNTNRIILKFYKDLAVPTLVISFLSIMSILLFLNSFIILEVIAFFIITNVCLFSLSYLILYYNIKQLYKGNINTIVKNKSNQGIIKHLIIKGFLVIMSVISLNVAIVVMSNAIDKYSSLSFYENFDSYYGFSSKYIGQENMTDQESVEYEKNNAEFYKSLDTNNTYILDTSEYQDSIMDTSVGSIYYNTIFANENYLKNIMNIDTAATKDDELTIYVPNSLSDDVEEVKKSISYTFDLNLVNLDTTYNVVIYSGGEVIPLNPAISSDKIMDPIIIQDNYNLNDSMYSMLMTKKAIYTKITAEQPYEYIMPVLEKYNLDKQVVEVFTPYSTMIKNLQELKKMMVIIILIMITLVITLILTILNITKIQFSKRGKEYTLRYTSGISPFNIFKSLFIEDIVFALIYLLVIIFIPIPIIYTISSLIIIILIDVGIKIFSINKNLKNNINNLIKGEL